MTSSSLDNILETVASFASVRGDEVSIHDREELFRSGAGALARSSRNGNPEGRELSRWVLWTLSHNLGCGACDTGGISRAMERGDIYRLRVPHILLGDDAFETSYQVLSAGSDLEVGPILFGADPDVACEPPAIAAQVLAAAMASSWKLPVLFDETLIPGNGTKSRSLAGHTFAIKSNELCLNDLEARITSIFEELEILETLAVLKRHMIPRFADIRPPACILETRSPSTND